MTMNYSESNPLIHHECIQKAYKEVMEWWRGEQESGRRCGKCWLRSYDCFCKEVCEIKNSIGTFQENASIRMCIYYHYQEIGRSANTAHLYEAIYNNPLPDHVKSSSEVILFGDIEAEAKLIKEMNEEQESGCPLTCVLYPANSAVSLNTWLKDRPPEAQSKPVRIIVLDGTYPQADRQWRHLSRALSILHGKQLPLVKLDLDEDTIVPSALLGIQSQPGINKLCSFQAMVLALQQANQTPEICDFLSGCLDKWLQHILKRRVKLGKPKQNFKLPPGVQPAAYVKEFQRLNAAKKWTIANGPPPEDFVPISDTKHQNHNPRINNPYRVSSGSKLDESAVVHAEVFQVPFLTVPPAVVVYDVCAHSDIQLNPTKQFFAFTLHQ